VRAWHACKSSAMLVQLGVEKNRRMKMTDQFDEEVHMQSSATPESIAIAADDHERLRQALQHDSAALS